jgi:hypothetical protein
MAVDDPDFHRRLIGTAHSSVTISGDLIDHVRVLHSLAVDDVKRRGGPQPQKPNGTSLAIPAYILAVATVEASVNEIYLSDFGEAFLGLRVLYVRDNRSNGWSFATSSS